MVYGEWRWWGGLLAWSRASNNNNNNNIVVVFAVANGGWEWEGEGGCPGRSVVVSGKERWWGGALTCSHAPNDNDVIIVIVMLLSLTAGVYGGGWKSWGWFWRW